MLVPIPGTVPGVTRELATAATEAVHERGVLVLGTIGTSQEGAPEALAQGLALVAKEIGVDAHHVGDAGYHGVGDPHLLHAYSLAVRVVTVHLRWRSRCGRNGAEIASTEACPTPNLCSGAHAAGISEAKGAQPSGCVGSTPSGRARGSVSLSAAA